MKTRKKYSVLNPVQKSLAEGSTAVLNNGAIVRDIIEAYLCGVDWRRGRSQIVYELSAQVDAVPPLLW